MDKKLRKQLQEENDLHEEAVESSSQGFGDDLDTWQKTRQFGGDMVADDVFKYKQMRLTPVAQDKLNEEYYANRDTVLGNFTGRKPDTEETAFTNQTIVLIKNVFTIKKFFKVTDEDDNPVLDAQGKPVIVVRKVFDESFTPLVNGLNSFNVNLVVSSRGIGADREAILDRQVILNKGITKKNEKKKSVLGSGE